jgi:hypothetical protein
MRPSDLEKDDHISIDQGGLSDATFRVSSVEVEDIGITEVVAVGLVSGCDTYSLTGATADSAFTLEHRDSDEEWQVFVNFIERED